MTTLARSVELTPDTIIIDGEPLPWPLCTKWAVSYQTHPIRRSISTLSFAVLVKTITGLPGLPELDGAQVPWTLARPPYITRFDSATHSVALEVLVDATPEPEPAE
jgi:hypothetical protein